MRPISFYMRHILLDVLSVIIWPNDLGVLAWEWSSEGAVPGREGGSHRCGGWTWGCSELPANGGPRAEHSRGRSPRPRPHARGSMQQPEPPEARGQGGWGRGRRGRWEAPTEWAVAPTECAGSVRIQGDPKQGLVRLPQNCDSSLVRSPFSPPRRVLLSGAVCLRVTLRPATLKLAYPLPQASTTRPPPSCWTAGG